MKQTAEPYKSKKNHRMNGYTLIEVALVLSIVGLFLGLASSALHMYQIQQKSKTTKINVNQALNSLGSFLATTGRYPCPASLTDPVGTVTYGRETDCTDTSVAVGDCIGGICIEEADRIIVGPPAFRPRVRRGYVPWRELNIPEEKTYDGYGNRIEYVVTEALATDGGFQTEEGGIDIVDDTNVTVLTNIATAHFAIISHGPDGKGGFKRNGIQSIPCTGGDFDVENCNTTVDDKATYRSMSKVLAAGNFFDDVLTYRIDRERPLWKTTDVTAFDIVDLADPLGQVGVQNEPATINKLDISGGRLRIEDEAHLLEMCDDTNSDCFASDLIAGTGMACPIVGEFAVGVAFGNLICATDFKMTCPAGTFLKGVDASLMPICTVPPNGCSDLVRTVCSAGDSTLFAAPHLATQTITAGDSRSETWRCNGGNWQRISGPSGVCTCTPHDYMTTTACGSCRTGTRQIRNLQTCGPITTSSSFTGVNNCECVGCSDQLQTANCPAGYDQNFARTSTRSYSCGLNPVTQWWVGGWSAYTPWSSFDASCTCKEFVSKQTVSCPVGFSGSGKHTKNEWECSGNSGSWDGWELDTTFPNGGNDCTCTPVTQTDVDSTGCAPGWAGTIIKERTSECPGGGWGPGWAVTSDTCTLITYSWVALSAGDTGNPGASGFKKGSSCTTVGATSACWKKEGGGTYTNYPSCSCVQD